MLNKDSPDLSVRKQCKILEITRSNFYYKPREFGFIHNNEFISDSILANEIYELWQEYSFMGYRKITAMLKLHKGYNINKKRISRLMQSMNIGAIYAKPNLSKPDTSYKYPYLLNDIDITIPNQVWETDITYIRLKQGFVYLLAIIDVCSRYVVSWKISNNMEIDFCLSVLEDALKITKPNILNTDQGSQFTSNQWVNTVLSNDIKVSMDGKGRWADNIFIERFWRSVKYEEIFINPPDDFIELKSNVQRYINFYNNIRPHQSLNYTTPSNIFTNG
tara:strand:- start:183 stop:1010 length:828 start_codon:yes stop_codon:yes gene_type:complete